MTQLRLQPFVYNFGVRFALGGFHDLSDKESKQVFLALTVLFKLLRTRYEHLIDYAIDLASVTDLDQSLFLNDRRGGPAGAATITSKASYSIKAQTSFWLAGSSAVGSLI